MDAEETQYWVAYFALQGSDYRQSIENKMHIDRQSALSDIERAKQIKGLFTGKRK